MLSTTVNMRGRAHTTYNVSNRRNTQAVLLRAALQSAWRIAAADRGMCDVPLCRTALNQIDLKDVGSNSKISIKVRPADKIEGEQKETRSEVECSRAAGRWG